MKNLICLVVMVGLMIGMSMYYLNEFKKWKVEFDTKYSILEYVDDDLIAVR